MRANFKTKEGDNESQRKNCK